MSNTPHILPPLPYVESALDPVISSRTVGIHYGKHHKTYVDNLNKLIIDTELAGLSLEEIISKTASQANKAGIFNNAAQIWNHTFYWNSLSQRGGGEPPLVLKQKIESSFGNLDSCKKELAAAAMTQFGSGWAWLVMNGDKLEVTKTANAESPLSMEVKPLLVIDVWENAYYLDYENRRIEYVNAVIEKLINWGSAEDNLG